LRLSSAIQSQVHLWEFQGVFFTRRYLASGRSLDARSVGPISWRQVTPWRSSSQNPEKCVDKLLSLALPLHVPLRGGRYFPKESKCHLRWYDDDKNREKLMIKEENELSFHLVKS